MTKTIYAIGLVLLVVLAFSCRKDSFNTSSDFQLEFSRDSILFDTVFTTIGSATQVFKIYNPDDKNSIEIDDISLAEGESSKFRINVDGVSGITHQGNIIAPSDSLYVFVEVTLDANDESLPYILIEDLLVNANGSEQVVTLVAWGQNAYFHGGLGGISVLECDEVWNNDLPHVLFGIVAVDSSCCLTINQGVQVHCHASSGLYVYKGCIESNGVLGNEVVFQGDRLESLYEDVPGQWGIELDFIVDFGLGEEIFTVNRGGIWLTEAQASFMDYTIVKNGIIGLQVDSTGAGSEDVLQLRNCIIHNHSAIGVVGQGATMSGYNNLFANCGQSVAAFQIGGEYKFDHCTFANYWSNGTRQAPAFVLNNHYETADDDLIIRSLGESRFRNCVFYGDNANLSEYSEFIIDVEFPEDENYVFENCAVDTEQDITDPVKFINMTDEQDPNFLDVSAFDFRPSLNSILRQSAIPLGGVLATDLAGELRLGGEAPDIGCLEYVP